MGVKEELQKASEEGSGNPFFELTEVELDTSFALEVGAEAEGGFKFFVSLKGNTTAGQTHAVKIKFKPLPVSRSTDAVPVPDNSVPPADFLNPLSFTNTTQHPDSPTMPIITSPSQPTGPTFQNPTQEYLQGLKDRGFIDSFKLPDDQ